MKILKKTLLLSTIAIALTACNVNPNKEERIQLLENQVEVANESIIALTEKIALMEIELEALEEKVGRMENE